MVGKNIAVTGIDTPGTSLMKAMGNFPKAPSDGKDSFNARTLLHSASVAGREVRYRASEILYSQGDPAATVMCVLEGSAKLSVINEAGKEAILGILGPGNFLGEGCLAGQPVRMGMATALTTSTVMVIEKREMLRALRAENLLSGSFLSHLLAQNIRIEENLVDQLFNSTEKRLARCLLLLAGYGEGPQPRKMLPKITQETLAGMIGTTRSRVNLFMNKFKKLGFIKNRGELHIEPSLAAFVLNE
jgi:CRP/FNR family cyclic AMP-dependent transcriptional regulator